MAWVAVTVLVDCPYVEKIEKLRSSREQFFSYFTLAIGIMERTMVKVIVLFLNIVMWGEKRFGREMFQDEPIVKNLTSFSRNTTPLIYIILYIYLLSHEKTVFRKMYKKTKIFCAKSQRFKKTKKF